MGVLRRGTIIYALSVPFHGNYTLRFLIKFICKPDRHIGRGGCNVLPGKSEKYSMLQTEKTSPKFSYREQDVHAETFSKMEKDSDRRKQRKAKSVEKFIEI